jgi:hypothetical protein
VGNNFLYLWREREREREMFETNNVTDEFGLNLAERSHNPFIW